MRDLIATILAVAIGIPYVGYLIKGGMAETAAAEVLLAVLMVCRVALRGCTAVSGSVFGGDTCPTSKSICRAARRH